MKKKQILITSIMYVKSRGKFYGKDKDGNSHLLGGLNTKKISSRSKMKAISNTYWTDIPNFYI